MSGLFSIAEDTQVIFSPGNVRYDNGTFSFAQQQIAVYAGENAEIYHPHTDLFLITNGGGVQTYLNDDVTDRFNQWKDSLTEDWFIPTVSQWKYLLSERKTSTISGVGNARFMKCTVRGTACLVLFPDDFIFPDNVELPSKLRINDKVGDFSKVKYDYVAMKALEKAGCVLLPAINWDWERNDFTLDRIRHGYDLPNAGRLITGYYWALSNKKDDNNSHHFIFSSKHYQIVSHRQGLEYSAFMRLVTLR